MQDEVIETEVTTEEVDTTEDDPNFTDDGEEGTQTEEPTTEEDNKEVDETNSDNETKGKKSSYYAQLRREREAKEQANNQNNNNNNEDLYYKGVIAGTGGKNPYTGKEIKDQFDLQEFELMQKLDREGKDPVNDYLDALKSEKREQFKSAEQEKQEQARIEQERETEFKEFEDKYGTDKLVELSKNKDFLEFADNFKDSAKITQIYEIYNSIEKRAEELATQKYARKVSSTGGSNQRTTTPTHKSFKDMSPSEFLEYQNKVRNGEI